MNKNVIRLAGGVVVLVAYLGRQVFSHNESGTAPVAAKAGAAVNAHGYVVYPDLATEKALGLDYPTFNGDFVNNVVVTPLPPYFPGATLLRVVPGQAHAIDVALNDTRCASPVHVAVYRINDRTTIASAALDAKTTKFSVPFGDGKLPAMLVDLRMDEKAQNNYWCGVTISWAK
jgi:hypothetical protein